MRHGPDLGHAGVQAGGGPGRIRGYRVGQQERARDDDEQHEDSSPRRRATYWAEKVTAGTASCQSAALV